MSGSKKPRPTVDEDVKAMASARLEVLDAAETVLTNSRMARYGPSTGEARAALTRENGYDRNARAPRLSHPHLLQR